MTALSPEQLTQAWSYGRRAAPAQALAQFTWLVTGNSGGLACNGIGMLPAAADTHLYHPDGEEIPLTRCSEFAADRVLTYMHIRQLRVASASDAPPWISLLIAALRLGVIAQMLDISYAHLEKRTSFGQKTTRHQLVKASFAAIFGEVTQLRSQLGLRVAHNDYLELEQEHMAITLLAGQAEKLMGGHGYLLGNTHTLSHFSMMMYCAFGKTGSGISQADEDNPSWKSNS